MVKLLMNLKVASRISRNFKNKLKKSRKEKLIFVLTFPKNYKNKQPSEIKSA